MYAVLSGCRPVCIQTLPNGHRDCLLLNENEAKEEKNWMKRIDVYTKSKFINGDES